MVWRRSIQEPWIWQDAADASHDEREVRAIRQRVGMVFQQFNLFPHLSILDNITWLDQVKKVTPSLAEKRAVELLEQMGIAEQARKFRLS